MIELGKTIRIGMLKKNMSNSDLAKILDVTPSAVSQYINCKRLPSANDLIRIACELEIVPDLFPGYVKAEELRQNVPAHVSGNDPPPEPKEDREDREDRVAKLEREIAELRKELDSMQEIRSIVESLQRKS